MAIFRSFVGKIKQVNLTGMATNGIKKLDLDLVAKLKKWGAKAEDGPNVKVVHADVKLLSLADDVEIDAAKALKNGVDDPSADIGEAISAPVKKAEANMNAAAAEVDAKAPADGPEKTKWLTKRNFAAAFSILIAFGVAVGVGLVIKGYLDRANKEQQQCLAAWATKYNDLIKGPDGTLLKIDTPEQWTANMAYLQIKIDALPTVKGDPVKAQAMLMEMYADLNECISIDTSPIGAALKGLSDDVGGAIKGILGAGLDPIQETLVKVGIVAGVILGLFIVLAIVYAVIMWLKNKNVQITDRVSTGKKAVKKLITNIRQKVDAKAKVRALKNIKAEKQPLRA
jgi:hypothetical protein